MHLSKKSDQPMFKLLNLILIIRGLFNLGNNEESMNEEPKLPEFLIEQPEFLDAYLILDFEILHN